MKKKVARFSFVFTFQDPFFSRGGEEFQISLDNSAARLFLSTTRDRVKVVFSLSLFFSLLRENLLREKLDFPPQSRKRVTLFYFARLRALSRVSSKQNDEGAITFG